MNSSPTKLILEQLNNHYILFRHGQSKANIAKIVVSRPENGIPSKGVGPPSPYSTSNEGNGWGLTEFGKEQVKTASQDLMNYFQNKFPSKFYQRNQEIDDDKLHNSSTNQFSLSENFHIKIFTSPFIRSVETANILLEELLLINNISFTIYPKVIIHDDLRERNFGIFELKSDHESYSKVWEMDESFVDVNKYKEFEIETCEQVRSRMCNLVNEIEQQSQQSQQRPLIAILVSHGDSLQILQTAFENVNPNLHRSLNHLETAQWRAF
ncbi:histidine phosphatase superfamily [Glomus cerebriforme]|uniref:Histidine phosphatase superfamily n=1 Tax=Glomus cerebriforme TaxID=658196 RepID=A0A397TI15_9GLOM|nr:histidine phosphatase superfamily [Glomus cerebriforme]